MSDLVECSSTGTKLPETVARDIDEMCKSLPSDCTYQRKAVNVDYQFEPGERAEVSVLSAATKDKMNEVVLPQGVDLDPYRKSMVVLWNHDQNKPVAECGWIKLHHDRIRAKTNYPAPDESKWGEFVQDVWSMTKSGLLRMKSIGFIPKSPKREPTSEELESNPDWAGAGVWDNTVLVEYSCCTVGICNDAVIEAVNAKSVTAAVLKSLGVEVPEIKAGITLEQAKAIAAGTRGMKRVKKKSINWDKLFADAVNEITIDVDRIVNMAKEMQKNRGKV